MDLTKIPTVKKAFFRYSISTGSRIIMYTDLLLGILVLSSFTFLLSGIGNGIMWIIPLTEDDIYGYVALYGFITVIVSFIGLYGVYLETISAIVIYISFKFIVCNFYLIQLYQIVFHPEVPAQRIFCLITTVFEVYTVIVLFSYFQKLWIKRNTNPPNVTVQPSRPLTLNEDV